MVNNTECTKNSGLLGSTVSYLILGQAALKTWQEAKFMR